MGIIQRYVGVDAPPNGERASTLIQHEAFAPLDAPVTIETLDNHPLRAHALHSVASTQRRITRPRLPPYISRLLANPCFELFKLLTRTAKSYRPSNLR